MLAFLPAVVASSHAHNHVGFVVFGVAFIAIGISHAIKQDISWRMSRWQFKNPTATQPSAAGLTMIRISGVVVACVGIAIMVANLR